VSITIRQFQAEDSDTWDRFCEDAFQSTLLHTRRFLSYHGERFTDRSLILTENGRWLGLFPAALIPGGAVDTIKIGSHPGSTYGGIVHQGGLQGARMLTAFEKIAGHYAGEGVGALSYKAVPGFYHRVPAQDDLYALFRLGARRVRCDISSTIDLANRRKPSERRRRSLRKAVEAGVKMVEGNGYLNGFWDILGANLARRHDAKPVHTREEIVRLAESFPKEIRCVCGMVDGRMVAGTVLFLTATTVHTQYIAATEEGFSLSALDAVFDHCLLVAGENGHRWLDFGTSNEHDGHYLNEGLYVFKSEFGGGGTVYETYELDLRQ
jgi:CelD/BcsL family acetyltransferase involved in cellulose biosynthesis